LDEVGNGWVIEVDAGTRCEIRHEGPLGGTLREGEEDPRRGWYSPCFGRKRPAPRLEFSGPLSPGQASRTVLKILGAPA
jgi:hypothetical protein